MSNLSELQKAIAALKNEQEDADKIAKLSENVEGLFYQYAAEVEEDKKAKIAPEIIQDLKNLNLLKRVVRREPTLLFLVDNVESMKALIAFGADVNAKDKYGITLLMNAKTAEQTKLLLEAGADVNAKSEGCGTALMYAKTAEKIKLLIEAGADVNAKNDFHKTALMFAKTAEKTKLLIEAGADVNAKNDFHKTALMFAETAEQTKLLLEAGADVNAHDRNEATALMFAETAEQTKLLIEAGADVNAHGNLNDTTVLMNAKTAEQTKLLLEAGADVNAKDENYKTALMYAKTAEQTKLLLEAGADVNIADFKKETALMKAEIEEQTKLLLEAGADVNAKNKKGETALWFAKTLKQKQLLLEAGCSPNDEEGMAILDGFKCSHFSELFDNPEKNDEENVKLYLNSLNMLLHDVKLSVKYGGIVSEEIFEKKMGESGKAFYNACKEEIEKARKNQTIVHVPTLHKQLSKEAAEIQSLRAYIDFNRKRVAEKEKEFAKYQEALQLKREQEENRHQEKIAEIRERIEQKEKEFAREAEQKNKELAEKEEKLSQRQTAVANREENLTQIERKQLQLLFEAGENINKYSAEDKEQLFTLSKQVLTENPRLTEVALDNMFKVYTDAEGAEKKKYLQELYEVRKGGKDNAEKRNRAKIFATVISRNESLSQDANLKRLSKVDTLVSQPTKTIKRLIERSE